MPSLEIVQHILQVAQNWQIAHNSMTISSDILVV